MEMVFIATADASGDCDASLRAGSPGFLRVLDDRTLAYPEYRGNGVMASLGNLSENPHIGLLMIDFVEDLIGLHVNGRADVLDTEAFATRYPGHGPGAGGGPTRRAVGRRRRRRGLHPLPQAHPPDAAPAPEARLGHRRPRPQGWRLLPRPHARGAPGGRHPGAPGPAGCAAGQRRAGACARSGSAVRSVVEVSRSARMHATRHQAADRHDDRDREGAAARRPSPRRTRRGAMPRRGPPSGSPATRRCSGSRWRTARCRARRAARTTRGARRPGRRRSASDEQRRRSRLSTIGKSRKAQTAIATAPAMHDRTCGPTRSDSAE